MTFGGVATFTAPARCGILRRTRSPPHHISPAGSIKEASPAGKVGCSRTQVAKADFNSYGSRRGQTTRIMMPRHVRQRPASRT